MAKENEKKVSGEINDEELENVAGGWCATGGMSMDEVPAEYIESFTSETLKNGSKVVKTKCKGGETIIMNFGPDGRHAGTSIRY